MASETRSFESQYDSSTVFGIIRSGASLLKARRIAARDDSRRVSLKSVAADWLVYGTMIVAPAIGLNILQNIRTSITGKPREHPDGSWQFYLYSGLREDLAHHTNETTGYQANRPTSANDLDDLTAWVMTLIQFAWSYDMLMGVVWDEWTLLRLVEKYATRAELANNKLFDRLQRQWELKRPYDAPLNGTYADVRQAAFKTFITPRINQLPVQAQHHLQDEIAALQSERSRYIEQMSLLARIVPGRYIDTRERIEIWDAHIAIIYQGRYHVIRLAACDDDGQPLMFRPDGSREKLRTVDGSLYHPKYGRLITDGEQLLAAEFEDRPVGYLDMVSVAQVRYQLSQILASPRQEDWERANQVDILLSETPRRYHQRLRRELPRRTRNQLAALQKTPVIINWDERDSTNTLADLRRAQRGIGDHALTVIKTDNTMVFDQHHIFFDGTWSLAMAEVLTSAAVQWCKRSMAIPPIETRPARTFRLEPSEAFLSKARDLQQQPEVSAETTIFDISQIFKLRKMLFEVTGTQLTVNDLLMTTRIFHAAHYTPSLPVQSALDEFRATAITKDEEEALQAIEDSLQRGRLINPALLIPVDASPSEPYERIYPITFRNLLDQMVWIWDDTWEAYQAYRRIEPPNTPEGIAAYDRFVERRRELASTLRTFSSVFDAMKRVALSGGSVNIAILKLLVGLPAWMQYYIRGFAEVFAVVNEIARGEEVYSNVGRVAKGSTLSRFMSARDDGKTKTLVWGIMTDDNNRMIVTMRDFRLHVKPLMEAGHEELARKLAQDYVNKYTEALIGLVARMWAMLKATDPRTLE